MGKVKHRRLRVSRYAPTKVDTGTNINSSSQNISNENGASNLIPNISQYAKDEVGLGNGVSHSQSLNCSKEGLSTALEKIRNKSSDERVTGLNMLASFALESSVAESIIEKKLISSITVLLQDKNCQVRLAAAGTLRNLCSWGNDDLIENVVQQDIMQPLSQLLKTYETNAPSAKGIKHPNSLNYNKGVATIVEDADPDDLIFIQAVNVLWSLCECSEEALLTFNQENLVSILLKHTNPYTWNFPVSLAVADCLLCVSENNPKISSAILPLAEALMSLVMKSISSNCDPYGMHYSVVVIGILLNINFLSPGNVHFNNLFEILNKIIETDVSAFLVPCQSENYTKSAAQDRLEHLISSQMVAFEILSNICCLDDDDDDYIDEESVDGNEMAIEDEPMDLEGEMEKGTADFIPVEVLEGIKFFQLVQKTQKNVLYPILGGGENESSNSNVQYKLSQLHIRALQCLQNLVSCLPSEDLGGLENMYSTWLHLGQNSFFSSQSTDHSLLEAISGAMRAIVEKLSQSEFEQLLSITSTDLQPIFDSMTSCEVASVRANFCRMVGILGCSIIKRTTEDSLNGSDISNLLSLITEVLLKVAQTDDCLWVRAEGIDVIIDVYSDDKTDRLAASIRLVEKLKEIHPQFKAKFNQQKKRLGDHRPLVMTVKDNLAAFIKYKSVRTSKCSKMVC